MINPDGIPQYEGEPAQIIAEAQAMTAGADAFAATGQDVHGTWQGLAGVYTAPESGQLFAATQPVADRSAALAGEVGRVSGALVTFAETMTPIKARLEQLRTEARAFVADVAGDDDWNDDGDKVDRHNAMLSEVGALLAEWQAAERACANAIHSAIGSDFRYVEDDGDGTAEEGEHGYGEDTYDAALEQEADVPWGTLEHEDPGLLGNVTGFFQGVVVDGLWGDIRGLGTLVGIDGLDAAGEAWGAIGTLFGTALPSFDGGIHWELSDRESQLWSGLGTAMVAGDMWHENGGRATGQVIWNFGSLLIGGLGAVGKAGKIGKAGGVAGRVARISVDTLVTAGRRSSVGDLAARITQMSARLDVDVDVPERVDVDPGVPSRIDAPDRVTVPAAPDAAAPDAGRLDGPPPLSGPDAPDGSRAGDAPAPVGGPEALGSGPDAPVGGADAPASGPDAPGTPDAPSSPDLGGPPRQPFESTPAYGDGVQRIDTEHPPIDVTGLTSQERGRLGEALTEADLVGQGYEILARQNHVLLPGDGGRYFVPDFIARAPDGSVVAVESKFGPNAAYTRGQLTGYEHLSQGGTLEMRRPALARQFALQGIDSVDRVVTYRWNTEIVPDDALRAAAAQIPR